MNNLTTEEKIDYIYETVKAQRRRDKLSRIMRRTWRWAIVLYLIYFYFFGWKLLIDEISNLTNSILSDNMKNMVQEKFWSGSWKTATGSKIDIKSLLNKENLEKVKKYLNENTTPQEQKY